MIALDSNVLVRWLVQDDPKQVRRVKRLFERLEKDDEAAFISDVVLAETVWILEASYGAGREEVAASLREMLRAKQLAFSADDRIHRALEAFEEGRADFSDYLIQAIANDRDCETVYTFDKALLKGKGFSAP